MRANRSGKSGSRSGGDKVIDYAGKGTPGNTRRGLRLPAGAPVVVALAIAFAGSGASAGLLAYRLCTDGLVAVLWLIAAAGIGWGLVRRLAMPRLLRFVTAAALGLGVMSLVLLGLGLAGWLNGVTAWGILGAGWGLGVFWLIVHRRAGNTADVPRATRWRALWWLAMPSLGLAILGAVVPPGLLWQDEPAGYDVTEYHLQVPREWYQGGRIVPLHHNVFSYMPMNVEVHDLLAMHLRGGPWAGMYLAQFMHVGCMVLAVLAASAIASALSEAPWAGPVAGVTMAVVPWVTLLAPIAYNEAGLMLFGGLAVGWAMLARNWRGWLIAGGMAGFACGVKLTAGPMVVAAVLIAAVLVRIRRNSGTPTELVPWVPPPFKGLAIFVAASAVTFSPWLIRNQIWAHNPVFPERMETLGRAHFSEVQVERWRKAHSPTEAERPVPNRIGAAFTRILVDWRYGFLFLPLGVAAIVMQRDRFAAFLGTLLVVQLVVWLAFTHLQGRFYILAIPIAAMAIALVRRPTWPIVAASLAGVVVVLGLCIQVPRYASLVWPLAHNGALGVEDLTWLVEIRSGINPDALPAEGPIVLVGDAEAFTYSGIPMTRLRYRTVFDVPPAPDGDWLKAWTGDEKGTVIVSPNDLRRFKKTYFEVPTPPQEELDRRPGAYVLRR